MKRTWSAFVIVAAVLGLVFPIRLVFADNEDTLPPLPVLTAQWWQWAVSIPTDRNPQLDTDGRYCMVGQRGPIWFLAGVFSGGPATRTCSLPEGTTLFFPVINEANFNTPDVCGQDSTTLTVKELRGFSKTFIDVVTNVKVKVDGKVVKNEQLQRVQSQVFEVALPERMSLLPEDNIFDAQCAAAGLGNVPAGIYSPAVDDGYYVLLDPLKQRNHTIQF